MDATRVVAQAVGAWLQYQFACGKAELFSERYMSVPIAEALGFLYKAAVHSEYVHPVLAPHRTGPGRRPEVDFAVVETFPKIKAVLESKWVGKASLTAEDIIWDLLRLETIAFHEGADAYFVLAGRRKYLQAFFSSRAFLGVPNRLGRFRRLLKLSPTLKNAALRVDGPPKDRQVVYQRLFKDYQNVSFPARVTLARPFKYPDDCPTFQYQVWAWKVLSLPGTTRFLPANHSRYRV